MADPFVVVVVVNNKVCLCATVSLSVWRAGPLAMLLASFTIK